MQLRANNRRVKIGGRVAEIKESKEIILKVDGPTFPYTTYQPGSLAHERANFYIVGDYTPNSVTIDYGDGSVTTYPLISNVVDIRPSGLGNYPAHTYQDGHTGQRIIKITFGNPETIRYFTCRFFHIYGAFPSTINNIPNLELFEIRNSIYLTSIPEQFSSLHNLKRIILQSLGTAISQRIPQPILDLELEFLGLGGSLTLSDEFASNFSSLGTSNIANTLQLLEINNTYILNFPNSFANLTSITDLYIGGQQLYTVLPTVLESLINLESLYIKTHVTLTDYCDFSNFSSLTFIDKEGSYNLTTNLPTGIENCISLKTINASDTYKTQARLDTYIDNWYNLVTAEASMNSGNTKFRMMNISVNGSISPSGTYQQPTGFVLGSSNGTPASPLEKIWVMVNQYEHTWTY